MTGKVRVYHNCCVQVVDWLEFPDAWLVEILEKALSGY
jgi:hypothetical protein